ncbi:MAG: SIMPL domain-containing protein [Dehalococcoidia bacterium]
MPRLVLAVLAGFAIAVSSVACKGSTNVHLETSGDQSVASGITVLGVGEVKATPDLATVTLGVEASASTVAEARDQAADSATKLIAAVKTGGVAASDIQTIAVALNPKYEYPSNTAPRIVGYTATNTLRVTIKNLDNVGTVIDSALGAAGDDGRLQGIQFGFADREPLLADARKKAMEDARSRAEAFASGGGVKVGDILSVTESTTTTPLYTERLAAADFAAATPIEPGESATTVTVTVRYAIDR